MTRDEIIAQVAETLFANGWADLIERLEEDEEIEYLAVFGEIPSMVGVEITTVMPEIPKSAFQEAENVVRQFEAENDDFLNRFQTCVEKSGGDPHNRNRPSRLSELLAHYLTMEALGHGVAWTDDAGREPHGFEVPHIGSVWLEFDHEGEFHTYVM